MSRPVLSDSLPRNLRDMQKQIDDLKNKNVPVQITNALPAYPYNGQEILFQNSDMATNGISWRLRYNGNSASSNKWEYLGGPPLYDEGAGGTTASVAYQTTGMPELLTPRPGIYNIEFSSNFVQNLGTSINAMRVGLILGATEIDSALVVTSIQFTGSTLAFKGSYTAALASTPVRLAYKSDQGINMQIYKTTLCVSPVRVA